MYKRDLLEIEGKVFSGLGKGSFFVGLEGYRNQFKKVLGIEPFIGTLNLKVEPEDLKDFIDRLNPIKIEGFVDGKRNFGEILCYKVKINDILGYAIIPQKTHYKGDTVEVISDVFLREKLQLKDGMKVTISPS